MTKRKKKNQNNGANNGGPGSYSGDRGIHSKKRARYDPSGNNHNGGFRFDASKGYIDPNTGQRGAFPGLEGEDDDFYGPAKDGMDYLRMVRSEAKGIPTLLVGNQKVRRPTQAPILRPDILNYDDDEPEVVQEEVEEEEEEEEGEIFEPGKGGNEDEGDDGEGWYHDGAYTATIDLGAAAPAAELPTALTFWHNSLLTSFRALRENLHANPPPPLPLAVSPSLPVRRQRSLWQQHIFKTRPTPKELWGIDQQTVLRLLKWLTQRMSEMGKQGEGRCWAQWLWGLLVRLDDCLTADEASIVRELGKRCLSIRERTAIALQVGEKTADDEKEDEDADDDDEDMGDEEGDEELQEPSTVQSENSVGRVATEQLKPTIRPPMTLETEVSPQAKTILRPEASSGSEAIGKVEFTLASEKAIETEGTPGPRNALEPKSSPDNDGTNSLQQIVLNPEQEIQEKLTPTIPLKPEDTLSLSDTLGILDMVISLVGEFYGQKDLLSDRRATIHSSISSKNH